MLDYRFENNHITFFKYKALIDNEYHYFITKPNSLDSEEIDTTEYEWIEKIYLENTQLINALFKDTNIDKNYAIFLLINLLNSDRWEYGRWKIDKINEYKLLNLKSPYSEEDINNLHIYRDKIREIIRFYENL